MGNCREGHDKHICQMKDDLEKVKTLVKDAAYVCKSCGRAARNELNLCNPTKLQPYPSSITYQSTKQQQPHLVKDVAAIVSGKKRRIKISSRNQYLAVAGFPLHA